MEKHFSKKLRDLEVTPSDRAHQLFLSRLGEVAPKKEEKKVFKYFATAASVMVALGVLFYMHGEEEVLHKNTAVVVPVPATPSVTAEPQPEEVEVILPQREPVRVALAASTKEEESFTFETIETRNTMEVASLRPEISYRYHSSEIRDYSILDAHVPIEVAQTELSLPQAEEKNLALLGKVAREIQYVASGEKPDLDRAGIRPAATHITKNGLLANESRQIKEGVQRFKEIFR
jgi:hypothetical protein